jgi:Fic family protein
MSKYNWQNKDWPNFKYDLTTIHEILWSIAKKTGLISGKVDHLPENLYTEAIINLITTEAMKTTEIEGEYLNRPDVRSSIKNKLGLNKTEVRIYDKRAHGTVELMFDVRKTFKQPLSQTKLFEWHKMLFEGTTNSKLKVGHWRAHKEPMQIISGHYGKITIHFEAPPSHTIPNEMKRFIQWFNNTAPNKPKAIKFAPVRAAIAHLYFESIHPFEDGNGRIGRAIAEKALSQGFGYPAMLSISQTIDAKKKEYYTALNKASKSNEITAWIEYFANVVLNSLNNVEQDINYILRKSKFFDAYKDVLNERELKVIRRIMKQGFEGGISAKKYMNITGCSKATATRDLQHLHTINVIIQIGSGRSVRYELNLDSKKI